jgi:long-subunit acyl-CoA synthetase (AMP-forming)
VVDPLAAGARIDTTTVTWFRKHLDRKVHSFYGSSETGGIAYDDSEDVSDPLHVGRAMPETTIALHHSEGEPYVGRIHVEGNAVASGYADADGDPVSRFSARGFLTGAEWHWGTVYCRYAEMLREGKSVSDGSIPRRLTGTLKDAFCALSV